MSGADGRSAGAGGCISAGGGDASDALAASAGNDLGLACQQRLNEIAHDVALALAGGRQRAAAEGPQWSLRPADCQRSSQPDLLGAGLRQLRSETTWPLALQIDPMLWL